MFATRRFRRIASYTSIAASLILLPGCDALAELGLDANVLNEDEAEEVMMAAFNAVSQALSSAFKPNGPGDLLATGNVSDPFSTSAPCPSGGRVTISGNVSDNINNAGNGNASVTIQARLDSCRVDTSSRPLTVGGSYNASSSWTYSNFNIVGNMTTRLSGSFTWSGGGGSGSCPFDFTSTVNLNTYRTSMSGSSCGRPFSYSD